MDSKGIEGIKIISLKLLGDRARGGVTWGPCPMGIGCASATVPRGKLTGVTPPPGHRPVRRRQYAMGRTRLASLACWRGASLGPSFPALFRRRWWPMPIVRA